MYRLLIVTDDTEASERLRAMVGWEAMGFKPPLLCGSAEAAIECLQNHRIDAISVQESPAMDCLIAYINEHRADMPLFELSPDGEAQRMILKELYNLLKRLRADDSNDIHDRAYMLEQQRERWLRKVVAGLISTQDAIRRQLRLYRCRGRMGVPCVLTCLQMPIDSTFLSERWHYGSERLETALRNFFGAERSHMLVHVAVVSPTEVRVLFYPADEQADMSEAAILAYVEETVDQVEHYVGLRLKVLGAQRLSSLGDFAAEAC